MPYCAFKGGNAGVEQSSQWEHVFNFQVYFIFIFQVYYTSRVLPLVKKAFQALGGNERMSMFTPQQTF